LTVDAGIATKDNLEWLRDNNYSYIVCSRSKMRLPENLEYTIVKEEGENIVKASCVNQESTGEKLLFCHSTAREQKEFSMKVLLQSRFEEELKKLSDGLTKKGCLKKYDKILEKIGRLRANHRRVSAAYSIIVGKGEQGNATSISWNIKKGFFDKSSFGHYCLRSFGLDWQADKLWKIYMTLIRVEDGFRCLKSELGLRPIYHKIGRRVDGHLFISILAYHLMQSILHRLKGRGIRIRWDTLRNIMCSQTRVTTTIKNSCGEMIHIRSSTVPEPHQNEIYKALGISSRPGRTTKTVI